MTAILPTAVDLDHWTFFLLWYSAVTLCVFGTAWACLRLVDWLGRFFSMVSEPPRMISAEERRRQLDALLARVR